MELEVGKDVKRKRGKVYLSVFRGNYKGILGLVSVSCTVVVYILIYAFYLSDLWVTGPPHKIDWRKHHVVVFESDDWGACRLFAKAGDLKSGIKYLPSRFKKKWGDLLSSTLETPYDLTTLFKVLSRHSGGDGIPASFTANYILFCPNYEEIRADSFAHFAFKQVPSVPKRWLRGDFIRTAKEGIALGVWSPEYHGTLHMNPWYWMGLLKAGDRSTSELFDMDSYAGMNAFNSPEYAPSQSESEQLALIQKGLKAFKITFGFNAHSSIAPYYQWQMRTERMLAKEGGIRVIQGKGKQAGYRRSLLDMVAGKILNLMGYKSADKPWQIAPGDYNVKLRLIYLVRNVLFEPLRFGEQSVQNALAHIKKAWSNNEPAVISTHRFDYVTHEKNLSRRNLRLLDDLLGKIKDLDSSVLFLTDWELCQLYLRGYSIRQLGSKIVIRNFTERAVTILIPESDRLKEYTAGPLDTATLFINSNLNRVGVPAQSTCVLKVSY